MKKKWFLFLLVVLIAINGCLYSQKEKNMENINYIKIAKDVIGKEKGISLETFDCEIEKKNTNCIVTFYPKELKLGGGYEVIIDVNTGAVRKIINLQ